MLYLECVKNARTGKIAMENDLGIWSVVLILWPLLAFLCWIWVYGATNLETPKMGENSFIRN
jgi:hypothetical protein